MRKCEDCMGIDQKQVIIAEKWRQSHEVKNDFGQDGWWLTRWLRWVETVTGISGNKNNWKQVYIATKSTMQQETPKLTQIQPFRQKCLSLVYILCVNFVNISCFRYSTQHQRCLFSSFVLSWHWWLYRL